MKKLTAIAFAFVCASLFFAGAAHAQNKPTAPDVVKFEKAGGKVIYLGKSYDLDGWLLVKRNGEPHTILYMSPAGAMMRGRLFGPGGQDITKTQLEIYKRRMEGTQGAVSIPDNADPQAIPKGEQFYAAIEKANWVRAGVPDAPYIYMFINVNCEHCQSNWRTFKGSVEKGMLQIRIIPIGQEEANRDAGAAMLSVENPAQAWQDYMDGKKGSLDKNLIKGDALERLAANNKIAKQWKLPQIPLTVYRKVTDGQVMVVPGQPSNPMLIMPDLMKIGDGQ